MRIKNEQIKQKILSAYFQCDNILYNNSVIYKEIVFKNTYEKRINTILEFSLKSAWNIDVLNLNNIIKNKDYIPKHQYSVCDNKYKIDFFFDKLRIICEFDEFRHKYQEENDKQRMDKIIQYLSLQEGNCGYNDKGILVDENGDKINSDNCNFNIIRINETDEDGVEKLIGLVLGKIFSLC
jgi:very-short-patch-repair endonuclease